MYSIEKFVWKPKGSVDQSRKSHGEKMRLESRRMSKRKKREDIVREMTIE